MHKIAATLLLFITFFTSQSQNAYWQQRVEYSMNVSLDVATHRVNGTQRLVYYNNSPDTLTKVYYHLYFNAFQPGSMMDVRSRNLPDPDRRVMDRISKLTDTEIGYQHIQSLTQDGKETSHRVNGTLLEVTLTKPLLPKTKTTFDMKFESQVPIQIRRSGRNNREGIAYSMTQWYPKMAEYDYQGWHAYQYVAREFHGVWGDFDVKITIDPSYVIGGTGKLQNADKIGHGYEKAGAKVERAPGNLTWHFIAKDVIDFTWAADPEYTHDRVQVPNGPEVHFFYQKNEKTAENWKKMQDYAVQTFQHLNKYFGKYPFDTYSVIQGGDGGMEYPMCTLILGEGPLTGVTGTMAHEIAHSWYQMTLASNESLYAWMDEGFTDFASSEARATFFPTENPHAGSYASYFSLVASGLQEIAGQHSDHFSTNRAYGTAAYSEGAIFLQQLKYLIGNESFYKGMLQYYNTWKMKHPEPNDFVRVMEKVSGLQLHWYLRYWIYTTKRIDYAITSVAEKDGNAYVTLDRLGEFPMPIDLMVTYQDGSMELFYISTNELLGNKPAEDNAVKRNVLTAWPWVNPSYSLKLSKPVAAITSIEIDPSQRMADINRKNNVWVLGDKTSEYKDPTR
ncbi:MAG: M1 family metallopeptidase [Cyclobacteriaceae bacterium]|nr:M1 family metallopeptidase [Cyclobacteriaceae bacterium]